MCFRVVWEHGCVCEERGDVGQLGGQHGSVASSVSAGRGGRSNRAAPSGTGRQRLLHLLRAAGRLYTAVGSRQGTDTQNTQMKTASEHSYWVVSLSL